MSWKGEPEVLLGRLAEGRASGHWELPGAIEKAGEAPMETVAYTLSQQTGLPINPERFSEVYTVPQGARREYDAAECLTALVTNNRQLLETVAWSMMFAFVDLIRTKGPQHQLLRFLEGLASCAGEQIIENQGEWIATAPMDPIVTNTNSYSFVCSVPT